MYIYIILYYINDSWTQPVNLGWVHGNVPVGVLQCPGKLPGRFASGSVLPGCFQIGSTLYSYSMSQMTPNCSQSVVS